MLDQFTDAKMVNIEDKDQLKAFLRVAPDAALSSLYSSTMSQAMTWQTVKVMTLAIAGESPWYIRWLHRAFAKKIGKEADQIGAKVSDHLLKELTDEIRSRAVASQAAPARVN